MVVTTASISATVNPSFGGIVREYLWDWQGQTLRVVYETLARLVQRFQGLSDPKQCFLRY